jgi:ribosomal protein S18 acetylase RimI-like enzyme
MQQLNINPATLGSFEAVMDFYYTLTDSMEHSAYHPGWIKDVYPTRDYIRDSLANGELFAGFADGVIVSAMVINCFSVKEYSQIHWHVSATPREVLILHALGVSSHMQGKGIGKQMVGYAISRCRNAGAKALRLDVLDTNTPAIKLYSSMGFEYLGVEKLFYYDTGLRDFHIFEMGL